MRSGAPLHVTSAALPVCLTKFVRQAGSSRKSGRQGRLAGSLHLHPCRSPHEVEHISLAGALASAAQLLEQRLQKLLLGGWARRSAGRRRCRRGVGGGTRRRGRGGVCEAGRRSSRGGGVAVASAWAALARLGAVADHPGLATLAPVGLQGGCHPEGRIHTRQHTAGPLNPGVQAFKHVAGRTRALVGSPSNHASACPAPCRTACSLVGRSCTCHREARRRTHIDRGRRNGHK